MNLQQFLSSIDKKICEESPACPLIKHDIVKIPPPSGNTTIMLVSRDPPDYFYNKTYNKIIETNKPLSEKRDFLMKNEVPYWVINQIKNFDKRYPGKLVYEMKILIGLAIYYLDHIGPIFVSVGHIKVSGHKNAPNSG